MNQKGYLTCSYNATHDEKNHYRDFVTYPEVLSNCIAWTSTWVNQKGYLSSSYNVTPDGKKSLSRFCDISRSTQELYCQQVGNKIEISAVCLDTNFDMTCDSEVWLTNASVSPGLAYSFTIDLWSKCCTRTQIDRASVEFSSTHPYRHEMCGKGFNYFMACNRPGFNLPYRDVVKVRQWSMSTKFDIEDTTATFCKWGGGGGINV